MIIRQGRTDRRFIKTGYYIHRDSFDNKEGICLKGHDKHRINNEIDRIIEMLKKIIQRLQDNGKLISAKSLKEQYEGNYDLSNFYEFGRIQLRKEKKISDSTYGDYLHCLNQLNELYPNLKIKHITESFLREYLDDYLTDECGRKPNGVYHNFATIRKFYLKALKLGLVTHNPFENYTYSKEKTEISFMEPDELDVIVKYCYGKEISSAHYKSLYYYILSCLTGLRRKDVYELSLKVHQDRSELESILRRGLRVKTSKSGYKKTASVPIYPDLAEHLQRWPNEPMKQSGSRVNSDLRQVLAIVKIEKHITFHTARHTFAVVGLMSGINPQVIQDILTHDSFQTTEIYTHIVDSFKETEIKKMSFKRD